uniref:Uncharacterized protein n=1 Tax=Globisporangium ultimum (strain ATCC 200006 / CBS 805.95 / DAOM BR144) TaxID=431595 RepID=K3W5Z0_GLOUD
MDNLRFQPSALLLTSRAWNLRTGHPIGSSLLLWNKARQQRTTAILAPFVVKNGISMPPSYGGKECYFIACELAETVYAFSDSGAGSLGTDMRDDGGEIPNSILCEISVLHYVLVSNATAVPSNVTSSG